MKRYLYFRPTVYMTSRFEKFHSFTCVHYAVTNIFLNYHHQLSLSLACVIYIRDQTMKHDKNFNATLKFKKMLNFPAAVALAAAKVATAHLT